MSQKKSSSSAASGQTPPEVDQAQLLIPSGKFVLTSQHEDRRAGILVHWVQRVCVEPPMLSVAVAKGKAIMPLISESRKFALCQIGEGERLMQRKFSGESDLSDDPFLGQDLLPSKLGGVPILSGSLAYFECELTCHMDVEGDHDLFVGQVHAAVSADGSPRVCFAATSSAEKVSAASEGEEDTAD